MKYKKSVKSGVVAVLLVLAVCVVQGCAVKFGQDFNPQAFQDWVKPGQTTRAEVSEYLGAPSSKGMIVEHDGTKLKRYIYYYGKGKLSKMESAKFKMLEVRFDMSNLVHSFNWSAAD